MRTIVVINDNTPQAVHAAEAALIIAQKCEANVLLANLVAQNKSAKVKTKVMHGHAFGHEQDESNSTDLITHLETFELAGAGHKPIITNLEAENLNENELADLINKQNAWMLIHGYGSKNTGTNMPMLDPFLILNIIKCPLMFVPPTYNAHLFERMVYITDLRYCQPSVVRYLAGFAKPFASKLMLGHLSASGLPDMSIEYALSLFKETIGSAVSYNQLAFSNIKEHDVEKAIDVLVQAMHTDMLALVNHQFHFKQVFGSCMQSKQLPQIAVPIIVFPF